MQKRQNVIQKFSTFLSFSGAKRSLTRNWATEPKLERSIHQQVQRHPEKTAENWAIYFLKILLDDTKEAREGGGIREPRNNKKSASTLTPTHSPLTTQRSSINQISSSEKHLSAYLQEVCYYAAQKIQKQFRSVQYKYALEDLFQIGNLFVNQPAKLFRSFNLECQHNSLESYAKTATFRFIGNTIYTQDIEAKREKFSDYGLLRDLSNKELTEALASRGIKANQIDSYCLARQCFNAVCQPQTRQSSRRLEAPNQEDLVQISSCYNQGSSQLSLPTALTDSKKIQEMLTTCIQAARNHRTKRVLALDNDDIIPDPMPTPWETVIQIEEREQIESLVSKVFIAIPEMGQTLLKLWLGLDLTQSEIAIVLEHKYPELQKQYQVARQLGKYNRILLKEFLQQCDQLNPKMSLHDDKSIELIQELLDECLQSYCRNLVHIDLEQFAHQYYSQDEFLIFTDLAHSEQTGYNQLGQLTENKQAFIQAFEEQLEKKLNLSPETLRLVNKKIFSVVGEWCIAVRPTCAVK